MPRDPENFYRQQPVQPRDDWRGPVLGLAVMFLFTVVAIGGFCWLITFGL